MKKVCNLTLESKIKSNLNKIRENIHQNIKIISSKLKTRKKGIFPCNNALHLMINQI